MCIELVVANVHFFALEGTRRGKARGQVLWLGEVDGAPRA